MPFPYFILLEIICFIISIFSIANKKSGWWKYFVWFLAFTILVEVAGYGIVKLSFQKESNHWLYNLSLPVEFLFISWALYKICIPTFNCKPVIISGLAIFVIIYIIESISSGFLEYSFRANSFASAWITIICCLYFYYLLKQDDYIVISAHAPFWIITGCFFFYFGTTSCNFFYDYLKVINTNQNIPVRYIIFNVLNFILYSCWSYAFICKYRQTISSSSSS